MGIERIYYNYTMWEEWHCGMWRDVFGLEREEYYKRAIGCPEDITRLAWHQLSPKQQGDANLQADIAIEKWEANYKRGYQLCLNMVWV